MGAGIIFFEVMCLIEQIIYPILVLRTAHYAYGILTLDKKIIYPSLLEKGFILELFALVPFNLVLGAPSLEEPRLLIGLLRMNRTFLIKRLPAQLSLFGSQNPKLTKYLNVIKPTMYLAFVWHLTSCLWSWLVTVSIALNNKSIWKNENI